MVELVGLKKYCKECGVRPANITKESIIPAAGDHGSGRGGMCSRVTGMSPHMGVRQGTTGFARRAPLNRHIIPKISPYPFAKEGNPSLWRRASQVSGKTKTMMEEGA